MTDIAAQIATVRRRMAEACERSGRSVDDVTLLAVTKTYEPDVILEALRHGITDIGENRVQELMRKIPEVGAARWHLIGQLQTNKVKYVVGQVALIHSVDSIKLVQEIDKRAAALGIVQDILVQVNVAGEKQKGGVSVDEAAVLVGAISQYPAVRLRGLMNIALDTADEERLRRDFGVMRKLFERMREECGLPAFDTLSMGMSNDFEPAIEEGATMVRVGSSIFGRRI